MHSSAHTTAHATEVIAYEDLAVINAVAMMRLPLRAAETERLARMRHLLDAASELSKALAAHTHCALVNCRGTYGAGSLDAEAEALAHALGEYAALVRNVAADYRKYLGVAVPTVELAPETEERPRLVVG